MPLPSQTARAGGSSRTHMARRRRGRRPLVTAVVVIVLVAAAVGAYFKWGGGTEPDTARDTTKAAKTPPTTTAPSTRKTTGREGSSDRSSTKPEPARIGMTPEAPTSAPPSDRPLSDALAGAEHQAPPVETERPVREGTGVRAVLAQAQQRLAENDPVGARDLLNSALLDPDTTEPGRRLLREQLTAINEDLLFSPRIVPSDPLVGKHTIGSSDRISKLPQKLGLAVDWRLLARVNRLSNPDKIGLGQTLKIIYGPFNAVVNKSDYRLDIFAGPPDEPSQWMYIRSFPVGLGLDDSTPPGTYVVRSDGKLVNPTWVNPRTGEKFGADDPKNPLGERWIGLQGTGESAAFSGYGLHGTVEPDSIGKQASMGCVRLLPKDIEMVYEMLVEDVSVVRIEK